MFTVIAAIAELVCFYAQGWFPDAAYFTLNLMLPVITLVLVRWGWRGIIVAVLESLLYCVIRGSVWQGYIIYMVGNLAITVELLIIWLLKDRLNKHWYWAFLLVLAGWTAVNLARACLYAICYGNFLSAMATMFGISDGGLLALGIGELVILVCRKLDGLFENQKRYLLRLDKERKEEIRRKEFGDESIELDSESLSILNRDYDGLD